MNHRPFRSLLYSWDNTSWSSSWVKLIISAVVINIINVIWYTRNNFKFNNVRPNLIAAVNMIIANIHLSGNLTYTVTGPAIRDFVILKAFRIDTHLTNNAPKIMKVFRHPPIHNWVKCNTDGVSQGNRGLAAWACIFQKTIKERARDVLLVYM